MTVTNMPTADIGIQEVWQSNLEEEFRKIRNIVQKYPYVAMDTEFPGIVARPVGEFKTNSDYQYQYLRCNVDLLKIIQVGMTFLDESGNIPSPLCTWQFNFKFNLAEDMYAKESIDLLTSCGILFKKHEEEGIEVNDFAELLMTSGVILSDSVKWISFHSNYDFGYMIKLLTCSPLPAEEQEFYDLIRLYFPNIYDVKYLMKSCKNLKGGLQEVSDQLEIARIGPQHQAGSDSLLTGMVFFKMRENLYGNNAIFIGEKLYQLYPTIINCTELPEYTLVIGSNYIGDLHRLGYSQWMFFEDHIDDVKYCGHLYGLGSAYVTNGNLAPVNVGTSSVSAASNVSGSGNISTSNATSITTDNHSTTSTLNGEATSNSVTALSTTTSS